MASFLSAPEKPSSLRGLLERRSGPLVVPGCYDALGARLIELGGFDAVYMTGFGTSASLLGRPDVGLLGGSDMVDNARRISQATALPVIADADTGYGNPINVIHTVAQFEQAGVASIHLEDQVMPKRCGHMEGKEVVPIEEFSAKIRAAVAARSSADFLIIARTDARAPLGLDETKRRAYAALEAGADVLFLEALTTAEECEAVTEEFAGVPLLYNWVDGGKSPALGYDELRELGFAMIIMPITTLLAATAAMTEVLAQIRAIGTPSGLAGTSMTVTSPTFDQFTDTIGLPEITELQNRFR